MQQREVKTINGFHREMNLIFPKQITGIRESHLLPV